MKPDRIWYFKTYFPQIGWKLMSRVTWFGIIKNCRAERIGGSKRWEYEVETTHDYMRNFTYYDENLEIERNANLYCKVPLWFNLYLCWLYLWRSYLPLKGSESEPKSLQL